MKQRLYNVFYRYVKLNMIASLMTFCSYLLLLLYYKIAKLFVSKGKANRVNINESTVKQAELFLCKKNNYQKKEIILKNMDVDERVTLSIIMPAYNVEKYIKESVESVINQKTNFNYELIIINDGSTDNTESIINSINNPVIKMINQENQGLSGARNTGLNHAVGEYIFFIDSDDVLEDGSIDKLLNAIINNDADISVGGYYLFYDDTNTKQFKPGENDVIENDTGEFLLSPGFAWGKVFKRELFYNVRFPIGAWFEDTIICSVIYRKCKKMVRIPDCIYGYRQNWAGISKQSKKSYKALDHIWVMQDAIEQAHKNGLEDDTYLYELCFGHFSTFLYRRIRELDEETKENAFIVACGMMDGFYKKGIERNKKGIDKDIEIAFKTGNYKLWKLASFVV